MQVFKSRKLYLLFTFVLLIAVGWFAKARTELVTTTSGHQKECVVLLHGLARTARAMNSLQRSLDAEGYFTVNDGYPSTSKSIIDIANDLPKSLAKCGERQEKIHVVTHSLGGIVIRQYLQSRQLPPESRIVMLSPPNKGSELADKLKGWWLFQRVNGPAGQELGTENDSTPNTLKPVNAEIGIITGRSTIEPWFSRMIPGEDDGKVSVESAQLDEMKDFLVVDENHTFIMGSPEVANQVIYFLKNGRFQPVLTESAVE